MAKLPVGAWVMAQKLAATFVAGHLPNGKVLEGLAFPGYYYTFDSRSITDERGLGAWLARPVSR